ncbi:MAG TPA: methylated-DNA--[protein]-cysteine S-methyltransferase [Solirubrobacteraceae bacterium]
MDLTSFALFDTTIGLCALAWTERGVAWVQLPDADEAATRKRLLARYPGALEAPARGHVKRAVEVMRKHLAGRLDPMEGLELDYSGLPLFHRRVYEALRKVGPGQTVGYGELAGRIGSPGAARAVGQAVGRNPFPIVVPCHRVLAAGGRAGGFSAYGGVDTKRRMLAIEGVTLGPSRAEPELGFDAAAAAAHLTKSDARLARIIARVGPPRIRLAATQSTFEALAESIVYQQLTGKAAATIHGRLRALFPRRRVRPELLLAHADDALRGAGLSRGKVLALRDLAARTLDGTVPPVRALHALDDAAIVERLVTVRGIGRWTVEMLLIFRLGRPDVLPVGDYGVRHGFQLAYGKRALPTPAELERFGERWRPFRTVASWYLWRAVDLHRQKAPSGRA